MPLQHFLALVDHIPQQQAKRLVAAMTAARTAQLENADFTQALTAAQRVADPLAPSPAVFALRQSVKESDG